MILYSIEAIERLDNRSCPIVDVKYFLINLNLLKSLSHEALTKKIHLKI